MQVFEDMMTIWSYQIERLIGYELEVFRYSYAKKNFI